MRLPRTHPADRVTHPAIGATLGKLHSSKIHQGLVNHLLKRPLKTPLGYPQLELLITTSPPDVEKDRCWESVKARGEGDDRGRDGWTMSLMQPT